MAFLMTPEKGAAALRSRAEEVLAEAVDPNLCCSICHNLFSRPTRTPCG